MVYNSIITSSIVSDRIELMKKKWKRIKKVFCSDVDDRRESDDIERKIMSAVVVSVAAICCITALVNFSKREVFVSTVTSVMGLMFILCALLAAWKPSKRMVSRYLSVINLAFAFTVYILGGYNNGFSAMWAFVIPYASMSVIGLLEGTIISTYVLLLFIVVFWTPVYGMLSCQYPVNYRMRLPLLYLLCYVIAIYSNYGRKKAQLQAKHEQDRLTVAVEEERRKIGKITMQTIISISNAVDAKDPYTKKHSERVAKYSKLIANELRWSKQEQENIYNMALLHDIGKIGVPDAILNKHGALTDEEFPEIRKHPVIGGEILKDLNFVTDVSIGAYYHHERYDGKGYPEGLKGEEIPIEARIIGIADSIDAMNSNRVYRGKKDISYVLEQLEQGKGTQFDPNIDEIVIALIKNGKMRL